MNLNDQSAVTRCLQFVNNSNNCGSHNRGFVVPFKAVSFKPGWTV